jgi:hypothetical protein
MLICPPYVRLCATCAVSMCHPLVTVHHAVPPYHPIVIVKEASAALLACEYIFSRVLFIIPIFVLRSARTARVSRQRLSVFVHVVGAFPSRRFELWCWRHDNASYSPSHSLQEKPPVEEHNNDEGQSSNRPILFAPSASPNTSSPPSLSNPTRTHLLQQKLPIYPHRRLPILPTILPQPPTHLPHPLQTIPSIQQILDVLRHHLRHICQLAIQLVQITCCPRVRVGLFGPGHEGVEFDEGVGSQGRGGELGRRVGVEEFGGDVGEVGEGEFAGVGGVADAEEADVGADEVAVEEEGISDVTRGKAAWCMRTVGCIARFLCWLVVRNFCLGGGRSLLLSL